MDAPSEQLAIRVRDLVVGFGDQVVLDHLSLDVQRGEILGLVGASGGGKSVLLRTIIGLIPKLHGKIEVLGIDLDVATEHDMSLIGRRCGILFQQGALFSRADCAAECSVSDARVFDPLGPNAARYCDGQTRDGWIEPRRCGQAARRTIRRHDQACRTCTRPRP